MSQRPKRLEFILVSLAWSMPRVLLLPPGRDAGPSHGYAQQYVAGTHLQYTPG